MLSFDEFKAVQNRRRTAVTEVTGNKLSSSDIPPTAARKKVKDDDFQEMLAVSPSVSHSNLP